MNNLLGESDVMIDEDEYPIIFYEPNVNLGMKISKAIHLFSVFEEAENFAQSLEVSFLFIVSNNFSGDPPLPESLKKNKEFFQRRLADVEEESIVKAILNEARTEKSSYKAYVFFTCEDFESEEDEVTWEAREVAKSFEKSLCFGKGSEEDWKKQVQFLNI